ncbi:MAG: hypothetical protein ACRDXD_11695 [Acidimicrobiia bacterium]
MQHRTFLTLIVGAVVLLIAAPALAGGWAVTTFDELPPEFRAGETYRLGYTIRQHGQTPIHVEKTEIVASSAESGAMRFAGRPDGPVGHYVAEVRFPEAGPWGWQVIQGEFGPQELGTITVLPAAPTEEPARHPAPVPLTDPTVAFLRLLLPALSLLALVAFALQLAAYLQAQRRYRAPEA